MTVTGPYRLRTPSRMTSAIAALFAGYSAVAQTA